MCYDTPCSVRVLESYRDKLPTKSRRRVENEKVKAREQEREAKASGYELLEVLCASGKVKEEEDSEGYAEPN